MDAIPTTLLLTPDETAYLEACLARRRELLALASSAPDGHVLTQCEEAAVVHAQRTGAELLTAALTQRAAKAEQKKRVRPGTAPAVKPATTAAPTTVTS